MTDKKEVLEYLRNRQKAAEIEAKVNGINLWVLLGAIGIVIWQLLAFDLTAVLAKPEPLVRALLACEAVYLFSVMCSPSRGVRNELRYSAWRAGEVESPFLVVLEGLWTLLPPAIGLYFIGWEWSTVWLGFVGATATLFGAAEIARLLRSPAAITERFPKPAFKISPKADITSDLVFTSFYLVVIVLQLKKFWSLPTIPLEEVKTIVLMGALYTLCMVAIRRRRAIHSIQWTYELETDIFIGSLTPDGALRRIEHRALGPKLEDLMNKFFDELDGKLEKFESGLAECRERLEGIGEIPREFPAERADRIAKATSNPKGILDDLVADLEEFASYLKKLQAVKTDVRVASAIEALTARKKAYSDRIASARATFENVTKTAAEKE